MNRQDERGRAFAGSQLQLQIYVNRRAGELSNAILGALSPAIPVDCSIRWQSPLESQKFVEYFDADFLRVLGLERLAPQLLEFWPNGGPNWDGLAMVEKGGIVFGYLLVEAKNYIGEMESSCAARSKDSRQKIDAAFKATKCWLGVKPDIDWKIGLYQAANRLAHIYFLREICDLKSTWLINLCFTGDPQPRRRTSETEWKDGLAQSKRRLGLAPTIPGVSYVILPARSRDELLGPGGTP